MGQRLRQSSGAHPSLDLFNIIRHSPELDSIVVEVGNGKTCARISVTRLPHGTGIEQIALFLFNLKGSMQFVIARAQLKDFQLRIQIGKTALMMRVAVESNW